MFSTQPLSSQCSFVLKMLSAFDVCCIYLSSHQTSFCFESNNVNPDQTAPKGEQSDLGPYCLKYRLPKNKSRRVEKTTKIVTGRLKINSVFL